MDITKYKEKVEKLLREVPRLRDSDNALVANLWLEEAKVLDHVSTYNFLDGIAKGKYSSYESISRCRRKLQELNPELRGEYWNERHNQVEEVKGQVRDFDKNERRDQNTFDKDGQGGLFQ